MPWLQYLQIAATRGRTIVIICSIVLLFTSSTPLAAQCGTSGDPSCIGNNDGQGPDISIGVEKYTHQGEEGVPVPVAVSLSFSDFDVMKQESLLVTLSTSQGSESVPGWTWEPVDTGTYVLSTGTANLVVAGANVITVRVEDRFGNVGTAEATLTLTHPDPRPPLVDTDTYHNAYRNLGQSQLTIEYDTPSYTSMGVTRATTLFYQSERVKPSAYVHLDAQPGRQNAAEIVALSMQLFYPGGSYPATREYFWAKDAAGRKQRLGIYWPLPGQPTGAYMEEAAVRSYKADGTWFETRVPVRLLVVNDTNSRYGAGWNVAGIQRIWGNNDGVMLIEGDGVVRWFANERCYTERCHYVTPDGDFTSLTYEWSQMQFVRTYRDGSRVTFAIRGDQAVMTSATDAFGRVTAFEWQNTADAAAVPVLAKITDPMGKVTAFTYTAAGYLHQITDPAGRTTTFTHTAGGDLAAIAGAAEFRATYDASHRMTTYTNEQGTFDVAFTRDTFSSLTAPAVTLANGTRSRPVTRFHRAEWLTTLLDGQGTGLTNLAAAIPSRSAEEETIDPLGHASVMLANRYGQPLKAYEPATGILTLYSWNEDGLPLSVTYPSHGGPEVYEWNEHGQLLSKRIDDAIVYSASYLRTDRPPYYEYADGVGRWRTYGAQGELRRSWYGTEDDSVTNGTTYEYDTLFRLIKTVGPKGETSEWSHGNSLLDSWGNVASERHILSGGEVKTTKYVYDGAGRVRSTTDALGQTTSFTYDARNRVRTVTRPDGKVERSDYTGPYLTQVTDAAGKVYKFAYNALGWLEAETFPDGKTRTYGYDLDGSKVRSTDRRGWSVETTYDDAHRPIALNAHGAPATTYSYPDTFTTSATNGVSTVSSSIVPNLGRDRITVSFAGLPERLYEIKNVLNSELTPIGTDVNTYVNGALVNTSSTRHVGSAGGAGGRNLAITDATGRTTTFVRDGAGRHIRTHFAMGVAQHHDYSTEGRLLNTRYTFSMPDERLGTDYTYDVVGRLKTRTLAEPGTQWGYAYDALGRLVDFADATRPERYAYDAAHNRTDSGSTVEPNSNRYTTFAGYALEYDAEGNLTRKYSSSTGFDQRLTWNALNQLTTVTTNGSVVTYGYDPVGRRVRRTGDGVTTYVLYDTGDLLMELSSTGEAVRTYTYRPGIDSPLSLREVVGGRESVYYYILERPGHVRALLDTSGGVASEYRYTPFGEPLPTDSDTGVRSAQPLRFMARELDAATGLYYVRNRWYDPVLARFTSEDPIGIAGGLNTYAYAGNDPVSFRDPSGLCPSCLDPVIVECRQGYDPRCDGPWGGWADWRAAFDDPPMRFFGVGRPYSFPAAPSGLLGPPQPAPRPRRTRTVQVDCSARGYGGMALVGGLIGASTGAVGGWLKGGGGVIIGASLFVTAVAGPGVGYMAFTYLQTTPLGQQAARSAIVGGVVTAGTGATAAMMRHAVYCGDLPDVVHEDS